MLLVVSDHGHLGCTKGAGQCAEGDSHCAKGNSQWAMRNHQEDPNPSERTTMRHVCELIHAP